MIDKDRVKKNFSRAENYDEYTSYHNLTLKIISEYAASHLGGKTAAAVVRALDVGCGTAAGYFSLSDAFRKEGLRTNLRYIGVDFAKGILKKAGLKLSAFKDKKQDSAFLVCGDARKLPVIKGKFDIVFSNMALQWIDDHESFISECANASGPGALIILAFLTSGTLMELADSCLSNKISDGDSVKLHVFPETEEIIGLAEKHDLIKTGSEIIDYIEYGKSSAALLRRINMIGAKNAVGESFTRISHLKKILETYDRNYKNKDGKVYCTYRLAFLTFLKKDRPR